MRLRYLFLLVFPLLFNCPKKYAPDVESIEVLYVSSLYKDIYQDQPILAGIKGLPGLKVGHLKTNPPFMSIILGRLGFYELLNETGIDFVIADSLTFWTDNINYFLVPKSMGYAITNYEGIRFALLRKDKDTLAIADETQISLIKQRSDVLWIVENRLLDITPIRINFFIKDRGLADTTMTALKVGLDTLLADKIKRFKEKLEQTLNRKIYLEQKNLKAYILSTVSLNEGVNIILYTHGLFINDISSDSITLEEILNSVVCEMKFNKMVMNKKQIQELNKEKEYETWGKLKKNNNVLLPDEYGTYLFDMFYELSSGHGE
jgi:hypothetical protein